MTFAEKVLELRKKAGLSQEELAEKLEVSRQAISRWETGLAMPDASNLLQLSKLFKVSIDYLIQEEYSSDKELPTVKTQEASLNMGIKKAPAMIESALIGIAISLLLALLLFPFVAELPILIIPVLVLPFPAFYFSVRGYPKSLPWILSTSAVLLLAVNSISLAGFWLSYQAHYGEAYVHLILWHNVLCLMNAAGLVSLGSYLAFTARVKKWWVNLLIYILESMFWIGAACILYSMQSDRSLPNILALIVSALLCIVGCAAYAFQTKRKEKL